MKRHTAIRKALLGWYESNRRDLPWRKSRDPYRIWISEIMLQQTRVSAVIPYYSRFLERFPDVESLAGAPEAELLRAWAGLGYYSRARNLREAARQILSNGRFPRTYEEILQLKGVGEYTAAAIGSIAFNLPLAALDGNVLRVISRLENDNAGIDSALTKKRYRTMAESLLDRTRPGEFNQAMMELGATICLPRQPRCPDCPIRSLCRAFQQGTQAELPVRRSAGPPIHVDRTLLWIEKRGKLLLRQRGEESEKLKGFWELPEREQIPGARLGPVVGEFIHALMNHRYRITVVAAALRKTPEEFQWVPLSRICEYPISTATRKAWSCWKTLSVA
jgi:A/G-specific adenine glycosylase